MRCPIPNQGFLRIAKQLYANDLKEEMMDFLEENPNPDDDQVHEWAEERGYEVDDIEEVVYEIATDHVQMEDSEDEDDSEGDDAEDSEEEEIEGGLADEEDPEKYDLEQLLKGIEVEFEHTDEPEVALEIAMDHLEEQDDYYDELEDMESSDKEAKMKLQGISQGSLQRIARKVKSQEWAGDSKYLEDLQRVIEDVQEGVQDYGEDVESAVESHASRVLGDYRLALQILQNSASVDREALQQLAYEAMKADIHNGLQ